MVQVTPNFFRLRNDSMAPAGSPWITEMTEGVEHCGFCPQCNVPIIRIGIEIHAKLDRRKGSYWPDILGSGDEQLFIISDRVLSAWREELRGEIHTNPLRLLPPFPRRIEHTVPPPYHWLAHERMVGARIDFARSGIVPRGTCPECGRLMIDWEATEENEEKRGYFPHLVEGSWTGADLFVTDYSPYMVYCTQRVLDSIERHQFTNFCYKPIEDTSLNWRRIGGKKPRK